MLKGMNASDMLDELYLLAEREDSGETLTESERKHYVELYDALCFLNIAIPFGISI